MPEEENMRIIASTLEEVEKILQSDCPQDSMQVDEFDKTLDRAADYKKAIISFINLHPNEFTIVAESTFQRMIDSPDCVGTDEIGGGYIKIVSVRERSDGTLKNYVWLTPIAEL